ncbi:MAG: serine/threonine protein kinase [Myxococcaceae bacterium]|nr:serine/threonine protein kinase [Myxococcaceae bacterium]
MPRNTRLLANRYEILGEVARGGCGAVYEARDLHLDRLVAIKILQANGLDRAAAARFAREARVASSIHHPNVCTVIDSGTVDDGVPFLVMERLYGETLRSYMSRGRLDADEAIELSVQMLSGLDAAHALNIVHRDMKPENVFIVRPHGHLPLVKLLDFGMCRRKAEQPLDDSTLTRVGTVVGTPEYMAPEQASGRREFDLRIDLYAVGVMLYEGLTGTRAFPGANARAVLVSVLTKALPSVRLTCPEIPVALDRIVARAVERDPRARYGSAAEFQHDLLHARTALRRQRAAQAQLAAQHGAPVNEWEMPTRQHTARTAFRRPA